MRDYQQHRVTVVQGYIPNSQMKPGNKFPGHPAEVDDLEEALLGQKVIIEPNSPSEGVIVAMIEVNGAPVELMQFS